MIQMTKQMLKISISNLNQNWLQGYKTFVFHAQLI